MICAVTGTTNAQTTARGSFHPLVGRFAPSVGPGPRTPLSRLSRAFCMLSSKTTKYRKSPKITKKTPTAVAQPVPLFTNVQGPLRYCLLYTSDAADERSSVDLG